MGVAVRFNKCDVSMRPAVVYLEPDDVNEHGEIRAHAASFPCGTEVEWIELVGDDYRLGRGIVRTQGYDEKGSFMRIEVVR